MWASKVILLMSLVVIPLECAFLNESKYVITVKGPNEQKTNVLYSRTSTVNDLKRAISKQLFIPINNQRILFGETELVNDTDLLFNHRIWPLPTIEVEERVKDFVYELNMMLSGGGRFGQIQAEPSLTVAQLKKKIFFQLGFYPQAIKYPTEDSQLEDNQRLGQLDFATKHVNLYVTGDMSHARFKVDTSGGWSFFVDIHPDHTVKCLKTIIQDRLNLPVEDQKLYLGSVELSDDNKQLFGYQMWLHESIMLDIGTFRPMRRLIFVGENGLRSSESIEVYVDETIGNIRSKVAQSLQKPKNEVTLEKLVDRNQTTVLFEGTRLFDYSDPSVDPLDVKLFKAPNRQMVYICVKLEDRSKLWLHIENSETISDLKSQIQQNRGMQNDLSSMHLFLLDSELLDEKSFSDYELGYFVTLELKVDGVNPKFRIVSLINGSTLDISVTSDLITVQDLKKFIKSKWSIPTGSQHLLTMERELLDDQELSELNLPSGTEISLATHLGQELDNYEQLSN